MFACVFSLQQLKYFTLIEKGRRAQKLLKVLRINLPCSLKRGVTPGSSSSLLNSKDNPKPAAWKRFRGYNAKGKCFGEIASEVKELAEKAADEVDVCERLAVEAFLGAMPWHFAREIRVKRIDSLKEALEEAKLCQMLEEEEDSRKRAQAITEDLLPARQKEGQRTKEARKGTRGPVCWGCGEPGHALKNCELWKEFRKGRQSTQDVEAKPELN